MAYNKSIKDIANNPQAIATQATDTFRDFLVFAKDNGINYQQISTVIFDSEETLKNFMSNIRFLKDYIELDEKSIAKAGHVLSTVNNETVKRLVETYSRYNLKAIGIAGKPRLTLFALNPTTVELCLSSLVESGFLDPFKEQTKPELTKIHDVIIEAEYNEKLKSMAVETNSYLSETYLTEMNHTSSATNSDDPMYFVNAGSINESIANYVTSEDEYKYVLNGGVVAAKPRVSDNVKTLAQAESIDYEKSAIVALFKNSTITSAQMDAFFNYAKGTEMGKAT